MSLSKQQAEKIEVEGQIDPLDKEELFQFRCHPGVSCFNECCRQLELALTPYDVLRLRRRLAISSEEFMDRHAIIEFSEAHQYPLVYLGMVDDGRASCPFVRPEGCLVYPDRPGACRTYPVGRGAAMGKNKSVQVKYVLLREGHCRGFDNKQTQNIEQWETDQEIQKYNQMNDLSMLLSQHPKLRRGLRLTPDQVELYVQSLYHLDTFSQNKLFIEETKQDIDPQSIDEEQILQSAISFLIRRFFGP